MESSYSKILIPVGVILIFSLITIWSTVPNLFFYQLSFLLAGLIILYYLSRLDLTILLILSKPFYLLSVILLGLTLIFGETIRGSTRWLNLGLFSLQTSEFVKPLLLIFYSRFLNRKKLSFTYLILVLIPFILVLRQPDLGSALVFLIVPLVLYLATNFKPKTFILGLALAAILLPLGLKFAKPYQLKRIHSFLNPYSDSAGAGYNVIQSIIAVGSGKFIGKGVSLGTQSRLNFLPEKHTDFIFASFAEEFGFLGSFLVISSYFILLKTMLDNAERLKNHDFYLVQLSIFTVFAFQTIVNVGMNLGLLPVTGITLPLFSYGGSSLISSLALIGIQLKLLDRPAA